MKRAKFWKYFANYNEIKQYGLKNHTNSAYTNWP